MVKKTNPAQRHERLTSIFGEAASLREADRIGFLEQACGDDDDLRSSVERLLAQDSGSRGFLDEPALGSTFRLLDAATHLNTPADLVGQRIGRYTITRPIASGGMGMVFEAEQESPRRTVALKVLRRALPDESSRRRFEFESEVLGRLHHPGIAQVYEAGVFELTASSGDFTVATRFFAMELVEDAQSVTEYVAAKNLSMHDRVRLLIDICDAVHHGHQQGVIHRDLKPANILVDDDGRAKVIDFGVARAMDPVHHGSLETAADRIIGTLCYMSPEQVRGQAGDVDSRADVYALGVVLYEVLAGRPPLEISGESLADATQIIEHRSPTPLGKVDRAFAGDLETIAGKALAKAPEHRYNAAAALGADLRRYLNNEPIEARPPSAIYQISKFARRNRAMCIAATLSLVVLVLASFISAGWAFEATSQRNAAQEAEKESLEVAQSLLNVILTAEPDTQTFRVEVHELERLLETGAISDIGMEARLLHAVAMMNRKSGSRSHARPEAQLKRGLELSKTAFGEISPEVFEVQKDLASLYASAARLEEMQRMVAETEATARALYGPDHWSTHPDDHLYALALDSIGDPIARKRRRAELRALRGELPLITDLEVIARGSEPLEVVLGDSFDQSSLDDAWMIAKQNATVWEHRMDSSGLVVTGITPAVTYTTGGGEYARVRVQRAIEPIGDFRLTAELAWDSLDLDTAVQFVTVGLIDIDGRWVVSGGHGDPSLAWQGEVIGEIEGFPAARSGTDSLPSRGEATIVIERIGGDITMYWNDRPFAVGASDRIAATVTLNFGFYPTEQAGRASTFGELRIMSVELAGAPAQPEPLR